MFQLLHKLIDRCDLNQIDDEIIFLRDWFLFKTLVPLLEVRSLVTLFGTG